MKTKLFTRSKCEHVAAFTFTCIEQFVESNTRTYLGRVGAGRRTAGWREGRHEAGQDVDGSVRPGNNLLFFPDMPCMKRVYRDKKASVHWSAARNKERFSSR